MFLSGSGVLRSTTACVLLFLFAVPVNLVAETEHVVNSAELQKAMVAASQARSQNLETVRGFLSSAQAEKAMRSAHMNPERVKNAVADLSDDELANLAAKASKAQSEFAAGTLSNRDLIWIILGIAVLVLVIVAVR